ncbi:hypothetical protein PHYBOEH_005803 [Phytophthora boehmeriae]|uniref:BZIP domain-containing protein n=1 Tax=Phytophthora boehmeriae TaxID=109152 RepID=A0A8T1X7X4_9STRA|nr:hypothetical protein PHYBOEH_005803 [Phytophthora boehmeriae]
MDTHRGPANFRLLVPSRFGLGAETRPQLWDAMMRSLVSSSASDSQLLLPINQPEEEEAVEGDESPQETAMVAVKRSKTNSERGRAFRARRKKYEDDLVTIIGSLRQEVADLGFLRGVRADKVLRSRNSMGGSLVRLAREYFSLFEHGMPSIRGVGRKRPALLTDGSEAYESKQEEFLHCAMDPELQFGGALGPKALLDQWKRYTSYHDSIHVEVVGVEVSGEEDNPMVTVRSDLHVVFSRATFDHVFPHAANNEDLVQRFIGREVVYHGVNRFQFSSQGQILIYDPDVGFVDALANAGATVSDIAILMQQARIADECRLGEKGNTSNNRVHELRVEPVEIPDDSSVVSDTGDDSVSALSESGGNNEFAAEPPELRRFDIDYLLS